MIRWMKKKCPHSFKKITRLLMNPKIEWKTLIELNLEFYLFIATI